MESLTRTHRDRPEARCDKGTRRDEQHAPKPRIDCCHAPRAPRPTRSTTSGERARSSSRAERESSMTSTSLCHMIRDNKKKSRRESSQRATKRREGARAQHLRAIVGRWVQRAGRNAWIALARQPRARSVG